MILPSGAWVLILCGRRDQFHQALESFWEIYAAGCF